MKEILSNSSLETFTAELASKSPVPGGGGAAALCGALAASLCAMAGNLTLGKKKYAAYDGDHKRMIAKAEKLREAFLDLIEADAQAFEPLSKAYSMSKDIPGYHDLMTKVTLDACRAPYHMMELCDETISLLEEMFEKCSKLMISDIGCGAAAAKAATESAFLNVLINTRSLPNHAEAQALETTCEALRNALLPRAESLIACVTDDIRRK